jgi:hypothetical protein
MTDQEIFKQELSRRQKGESSLIEANKDLTAAKEQFQKLDSTIKNSVAVSRSKLEGMYKELRRYNGSWPIVYPDSTTEFYPYYQGTTDDQCNPYYKITAVRTGDLGIDPIFADKTRTSPSVYNRVRSFTPLEDVARNVAKVALDAYPDISDEPYPASGTCSGETPVGSGTNESLCLANGGTWTTTAWDPDKSAPVKLKNALDTWKTDIDLIIADIYTNSPGNMLTMYNSILAEIANCKLLLPPPATYPNQTPLPTGDLLISIDALKAFAHTTVPNEVSNRITQIDTMSSSEEDNFFNIIKLRFHSANGSFTKLKATERQIGTNTSILNDNKSAISTISGILNP